MIKDILDEFKAGITLYIPGATGEIIALTHALAASPNHMENVHIVSCFLPGMNSFDYAALHPRARITSFLLPPAFRASFQAGKINVIPLNYSGISQYFAQQAHIDTAFFHVSPPDASGFCSFGIAADFSPIVWHNTKRRIAIVNPLMPALTHGPRIKLTEADRVIECESPLIEVPFTAASPELTRIAEYAAALIPNEATLQAGIGGAPGAIWTALRKHRDLTLHSGMITEGICTLEKAGALLKNAEHYAGILAGSSDFYQYMSERNLVKLADTRTTHNGAELEAKDKFFALNSALEIDLFGQVNLEWRMGQLYSGVGGAVDFARAATKSVGGRSITLMTSTAKKGAISKIVPRLNTPTISISRTEIDTVITEFGVAELQGKNLEERAQMLINISGEKFRDGLQKSWSEIHKKI